MAKQYKCTNYGVCPEADKDTVFQEVDLEEVDGKYVCPKCNQELELIEKGGGKGKGKLIAIVAAVVVLGGGGLAAALIGGNDEPKDKIAEPVETAVESPAVDDVPFIDGEESDLDTPAAEPQKTEKPAAEPAPVSGPKAFNLGWGSYEGPMQGGVPHGIGGEVVVTSAYDIDLKNGSSIHVANGDRLVNTKFKEGKLVQGYIHFANGEQKTITIGY